MCHLTASKIPSLAAIPNYLHFSLFRNVTSLSNTDSVRGTLTRVLPYLVLRAALQDPLIPARVLKNSRIREAFYGRRIGHLSSSQSCSNAERMRLEVAPSHNADLRSKARKTGPEACLNLQFHSLRNALYIKYK